MNTKYHFLFVPKKDGTTCGKMSFGFKFILNDCRCLHDRLQLLWSRPAICTLTGLAS